MQPPYKGCSISTYYKNQQGERMNIKRDSQVVTEFESHEMLPTFEEAMDWMQSLPDSINKIVRLAAVHSLNANNIEGCGIGSSDINHAVHTLYCEYKMAPRFNEAEFSIVSFCFDYI
jgi:hypothetical protein